MAIAPGTLFGSYEVAALIGVGGMGEVYRASDASLKRDVALKVLPEELLTDANRLARLRREAEVLASLNHTNIAHVYGLERSDGRTAIVMELVEGTTLAERIASGRLLPDEALDVALQIAAALEAAHTHGVVHRDLKPANIKLKSDGTVKVLDFGVAKALDLRAASGPPPTVLATPAMTEAGLILGTAPYMSPEQARGKAVDHRADIWAFGCVLYEMLTGKPAFFGDDVTATVARVLERDPDMGALPSALAPAARRTLELCLAKDPRRRIADIRDVKLALEGRFETATSGGDRRASAGWRGAATIAVAALVGGAVVGLAASIGWPEPEQKPVNRFAHPLPAALSLADTSSHIVDLSPDGRRFAYSTSGGIRLRDMATLEDRAVPGADEVSTEPTFSPDGQSIAYISSAGIRRIAATGGQSSAITDLHASSGAASSLSWAPDETILFSDVRGISRVRATGGEAETIVDAAAGDLLWGPRLLPDGDTVLFTRAKVVRPNSAEIVVQSISTHEQAVIVESHALDARYVRTGHLVYWSGNSLFGIAFDARARRTTGSAVPLVEGVSRSRYGAHGHFAIANDGTLAYVRVVGADSRATTLVWVDRAGQETPLPLPARNYVYLDLSPDDTRVALDIRDEGNDVWVYDLERGFPERLTVDPGMNRGGNWSPDGRRIAFTRQLGDGEEIYWQAADGSGVAEALTQGSGVQVHPVEITPDGTTLLYVTGTLPRDILMVPIAGPAGAGTPLLAGAASETAPTLSPDGRWLAYSSDESGEYEVYVRPFPNVEARRWKVSADGGFHPQWRSDGRELFYLAPRGVEIAMMAVEVDSAATFRASPPAQLFQGRYPYSVATASDVYDVTSDGQRFLMIKAEEARREIVIVQNWFEELERLVPTE